MKKFSVLKRPQALLVFTDREVPRGTLKEFFARQGLAPNAEPVEPRVEQRLLQVLRRFLGDCDEAQDAFKENIRQCDDILGIDLLLDRTHIRQIDHL